MSHPERRAPDALVCPRCSRPHGPDERLCASCRMPLTVPGGEQKALSGGHVEARKIDPRYVRGELVRVAIGRNQPDAELIQGILLEQGIPSMLRRTGGFDVPDFLAAGPRDVLVPAAAESVARELLADVGPAEAGPARGEPSGSRAPGLRLAAALLAALLLFGAAAGALWWFVP